MAPSRLSYQSIAVTNLIEEDKKPYYREKATMDPRSWLKDLTWYFMYLMVVSTLGPLQFGYHLVRRFASPSFATVAWLTRCALRRPNSTLLKMSSPVNARASPPRSPTPPSHNAYP